MQKIWYYKESNSRVAVTVLHFQSILTTWKITDLSWKRLFFQAPNTGIYLAAQVWCISRNLLFQIQEIFWTAELLFFINSGIHPAARKPSQVHRYYETKPKPPLSLLITNTDEHSDPRWPKDCGAYTWGPQFCLGRIQFLLEIEMLSVSVSSSNSKQVFI